MHQIHTTFQIYAIAYNIPRFFEFEVVSLCENPGNETSALKKCLDVDGGKGEIFATHALGITEMRRNNAYITVKEIIVY